MLLLILTILLGLFGWQGALQMGNWFAGVLACLLAGLLTLFRYLPVILSGTGLVSIVSNDFVESREWAVFVENLRPRAIKTWESWMQAIAPAVQYILLAGFLLSLFQYRKIARQRLPLQVFLVLGAAVMLAIQRVAPLARVWMYLEAFYLIFAAGGLKCSPPTLSGICSSARSQRPSGRIVNVPFSTARRVGS